MLYAEKDYKINPRIKEIIEQRRGFKSGITHAQAEVIIRGVLNGTYEGTIIFTSEDKGKIMSYLYDFNPNSYENEEIDSFVNFFTKAFNKDEVVEFVKSKMIKFYHPGMVFHNIRINNSRILYFFSKFSEYFKMYKGVFINTMFIGDVKKIYPDVVFDENTGEITDGNSNDMVLKFVSDLKKEYGTKLKMAMKDGIFVLSSNNKKIIEKLSTYGLDVEDIPEFYFDWK